MHANMWIDLQLKQLYDYSKAVQPVMYTAMVRVLRAKYVKTCSE